MIFSFFIVIFRYTRLENAYILIVTHEGEIIYMDKRMQPPPNYYGAPYGEPMMEGGPYRPNPQQMGYPQYPQPPMPPKGMMPNEGQNQSGQSPEEKVQETSRPTSLHDYLRGKELIIYCSYSESAKWHDIIYKGRLLSFDGTYLFLYDEHEKKTTIIPKIYINYIETYDVVRFPETYR